MKKYFNYTVKKAVTVNNLVTLEYLNLSSSFTYPEEVHDFFEFAYVDNGSLICNANGEQTILSGNDFFLIPPNVKHYYSVMKNQTANVFVVCFNCKSDIVELLKGKTVLEKKEKTLVAKILSEAQKAFQFPFDKKLVLIENPIFGAQQLIESAIEEVLINLLRVKLDQNSEIKIVMSGVELENSLVEDIISSLKDGVFGNISLDDICKKTYYSKTYLNNLFKKNVGYSIIQYYIALKVKEAKNLLKEGFSISEISDKLSFGSPNYFSKVFRKHVGVTPSEYKQSIYLK